MNFKIICRTTLLFLVLLSCEYPFNAPNKNSLNLLSISATIIDSTGGPPIRISQSALNSSANLTDLSPVTNATVLVIENGKVEFQFLEDKNIKGFYNPPLSFFARPKNRYTLKIVLPNGATYISEAEAMPETTFSLAGVSKNLIKEFNRDFNNYGFRALHEVFLDIDDDPKTDNYYQVKYTLFEDQEYCNLSPTVPPLLTGCRYMCWDKFENNTQVIYTDNFSNGQIIKNLSVGKILYNQPFPALLQISLLGITKSSYNYWKITQDQVEKQGSLADTPPVAYIGNISLTTKVGFKPVGYFMVAKQQKINYVLTRDEVDLVAIDPEFVKQRRNIGVSITPCIFGKLAPCYCKETETSTSKLPDGWPLPTRRILQPTD